MTTIHTQAPRTEHGTLPLKLELPVNTYAALDQLATSRGTEGKILATQLIEHAVVVATGKQPRPPAERRGKNGHVTDEELIRIRNLAISGSLSSP